MRVVQSVGRQLAEHLQVALCFIARHGEVVQQVVAAIARCRTRNLAVVVRHKSECPLHQFDDIFAPKVSAQQQVIPRQAAHRSPVDNPIFPIRVIPQIGGGKVLDGMQRALPECGFAVGCPHPNSSDKPRKPRGVPR